ncbi:MarR family transcriptional regulator [Paenibacillus sp. TRM 82003]|nr:MarR family transcriptional regulator [Paenibacillus sp. TRM 82003]
MEKEEALHELQIVIQQLHRRLAQEWGKHVEQGISGSQAIILDQLETRGQLKASDLAEVLNITSGGVTSLCDKLIKCGYAMRIRTEEDRRVVYLDITEKGREMLDSVRKKRREITELFYNRLSLEDIRVLTRINADVLRNITETRESETNHGTSGS